VLAGASLGSLIGGISGGFVAALLAIPTAGALQVLLKEIWQATAPDQPQESPAPAAEPADEYGNLFRSIRSLEIEDASGSCPRNAGGGALVS
jgi:hypothetical protein